MGFAELRNTYKEAQDEQNDSDSNSSSNGDYEERPYANIGPYGAIAFDDVIDIFYPNQIWDDGPVKDANGDIGLVLKGPHVVDGQLYRAQGRSDDTLARNDEDAAEYLDYYVINDDENEHSVKNFNSDGNLKGVEPSVNANEYAGEPVDTFEEDEVTVWLSGKSGKETARRLDVNGAPRAYYDDDGHTQGLTEINPDKYEYDWNDDEYPDVTERFARLPEQRDIDFEEHGGGFINIVHMGDVYEGVENGYYVFFGFNDFEGDNVENATLIEPVENPDAVDYQDAALVWHDAPDESSDDDGDDSNGDDQDFRSEGTDEFDVPDTDDEQPSRTEFLKNLPMDERRFVHNCVVDCGLNAGDDPLHAVSGGDMEHWMGIVESNYDGDQSVDEDLCTELNDLSEIYASILDGDIDTAREQGIPIDE